MARRAILAACLAALCTAALAQTTPAAAGTSRDYAYLFVQGKLNEAGEGRPVADVRIRLSSATDTFEALTDPRGFFRFEKVPVATYDLEVVTAEGEVIRRLRRIDTGNLDLSLVNVRVGKADGAANPGAIRIAAEGNLTEVILAEPDVRWSRFGKQALIFLLGAAALLAL